MASANLQQTVVKLNVGGVRFETSLSTLTGYPESMFATWFANWNAESKEEYFIDFDGSIFKHVLEFLRYGESIILPDEDHCLKRLLQAADYFQLPRLQGVVQQKLQDGDKKGLSGERLAVNTVVKLSSYGISMCVDSFVAHSLGYVDVPGGTDVMLGFVHPYPLFRPNDTLEGRLRHFGVCCPSCLNTHSGKQECVDLQLCDAVKNGRDGFANQLKLAQFKATAARSGDCVVISGANQYFGCKSFHVAKSFLCRV